MNFSSSFSSSRDSELGTIYPSASSQDSFTRENHEKEGRIHLIFRLYGQQADLYLLDKAKSNVELIDRKIFADEIEYYSFEAAMTNKCKIDTQFWKLTAAELYSYEKVFAGETEAAFLVNVKPNYDTTDIKSRDEDNIQPVLNSKNLLQTDTNLHSPNEPIKQIIKHSRRGKRIYGLNRSNYGRPIWFQ